MKKVLQFIVNVLLYIWQLPQNLVGLFVRLIYKGERKIQVGSITVYYLKSFPGGISLGNTIMVGTKDTYTAKHEHGHQIQSKWLGPLYLFVIGIPSIVWGGLYGPVIPYTHNGYYKFYTEKWADKLGGVVRN